MSYFASPPRLIRGLHPAVLSDRGLNAALSGLALV